MNAQEDTAVEEVTDTGGWIFLTIYVIGTPLVFGIAGIAALLADSASGTMDSLLVAVIVTLLGAAIAIGSMAKDTMYLREIDAGWTPNWIGYIIVPIVVATMGYLGAEVVASESDAVGVGLVVFVFAFWLAAVRYIYLRHEIVGVP